MESILEAVKDYVVLYLLVALLMQLIGDGQMNKYIRFSAGLVFLLLLMSPVYQLLTHKPIEQKLYREQLEETFTSHLEFDRVMGDYSRQAVETAVDVLVDGFNETLLEKGYEVKQYDCKMDEEDCLTEMKLYVGRIESRSRGISGMSTQAECARECKELLEEAWEPEFELKVYGKDGA